MWPQHQLHFSMAETCTESTSMQTLPLLPYRLPCLKAPCTASSSPGSQQSSGQRAESFPHIFHTTAWCKPRLPAFATYCQGPTAPARTPQAHLGLMLLPLNLEHLQAMPRSHPASTSSAAGQNKKITKIPLGFIVVQGR